MEEKISFHKKAVICLKKHAFQWTLAGVCILVVIIIVCVFFHEIDSLVKIAVVFSAYFAAGSVIYLALQIESSIKQEKIKRAYEYMQRFNDPTFTGNLPIVKEWINLFSSEEEPDKEKWELLENSPEEKSKLYLVFNFFEEMGLMYNKNYIDKKLIRDFFRSLAITYFDKSSKYIKKVQEKNNKEFIQWENLVKELKSIK